MQHEFVPATEALSDEDLLHRLMVLKDRINYRQDRREQGQPVAGSEDALDRDKFRDAIRELSVRFSDGAAHPILLEVAYKAAAIRRDFRTRVGVTEICRAFREATEDGAEKLVEHLRPMPAQVTRRFS